MILLKSDGHTSNCIAVMLSTNEVSVNNRLKRYKATGIEGLKTKGGQGRKPILQEGHLSIVGAAVEQERQRLSQARQIVEENIGRKMGNDTLTRFLKVMTAVTNG
jgi:transposase